MGERPVDLRIPRHTAWYMRTFEYLGDLGWRWGDELYNSQASKMSVKRRACPSYLWALRMRRE